MMQIVPVKVDGYVVFNVNQVCPKDDAQCGLCFDYAVAIHNWLMTYELKYVILDFQDEKEVCPDFLIELMQLYKRLRIPFLFAGMMEKPRRLVEAYDFSRQWPLCLTPEEAIRTIKARAPQFLESGKMDIIKFDEPIAILRPRGAARFDAGSEDEEEAAKPEEEESFGAADEAAAGDDDDDDDE
jgi:hypothetical protein